MYAICDVNCLGVCWYDHILHDKVASLVALPAIMYHVTKCWCALFGYNARLSETLSANQVLYCHINMLLGRPLQATWKHRYGRPCHTWLKQSAMIVAFLQQTCGRGHSILNFYLHLCAIFRLLTQTVSGACYE